MEVEVLVMVGFQPKSDYDGNWEQEGKMPANLSFNGYEVMREAYSDVVGIQINSFYGDGVGWIEPKDMKKAIDTAESLLDDFKKFMEENLPEEYKYYAEEIEVMIPITSPY
jgi:hypothetical protein